MSGVSLADKRALRKLYAPLVHALGSMATEDLLGVLRALNDPDTLSAAANVRVSAEGMAALVLHEGQQRSDWPAAPQNPALPEPPAPSNIASTAPWLPWNGGRCPVEPQKLVVVKFREGSAESGRASRFSWLHQGLQADIVSWCLLTQAETRGDGWTPWYGPKHNPNLAFQGPALPRDTKVDLRFRDGHTVYATRADEYPWYWDFDDTDIVHWRLTR